MTVLLAQSEQMKDVFSVDLAWISLHLGPVCTVKNNFNAVLWSSRSITHNRRPLGNDPSINLGKIIMLDLKWIFLIRYISEVDIVSSNHCSHNLLFRIHKSFILRKWEGTTESDQQTIILFQKGNFYTWNG